MFTTIVEVLRPDYLRPDYEFSSAAEISIDWLNEHGIEGVVFDGDHTLFAYNRTTLDESVRKAVEEVKQGLGGRICLISNTTDERRETLETRLGIYVVKSRVKKPGKEPFEEAVAHLGLPPEKILMVGDRLITDVAGGKMAGFITAKVLPLHPETQKLSVRVARGFEDLLYRTYQAMGFY